MPTRFRRECSLLPTQNILAEHILIGRNPREQMLERANPASLARKFRAQSDKLNRKHPLTHRFTF
jgi:hypothetical protein